jgi:hypothetical protein
MRKEKEITISDTAHPNNRDNGKTFILKEMPAIQAAAWADRVLLIISRSNIDLPRATNRGIAGLVEIGFAALPTTNYPEMSPLLDELIKCVDLRTSVGIVRKLQPNVDIEEISTVYRLRQEVFMLHADFFLDGLPSIPASDKLAPNSSTTQTSPPRSAQLSRQARRHSKT